MRIDENRLRFLRRYFDEVMFSLIDFRLSLEAPVGPTGFPKYEQLRSVIARLDPSSQTIARLFRLGEPADATSVEAIPPAVMDAFATTGLLVPDAAGWRTPNLVLVPLEGMLVFASVPPSYPTASGPCSVWFDLSSYVIARALPGSLAGARVLDVCSGTGIQSLLCAARGAASTLGLEINEQAVEVARINAAMNGLGASIEFRRSDRLAGLRDAERFDFVVCNTPYAPVLENDEAPAGPAAVGNSVLFGVLEELPGRLSEEAGGIIATWRSIGRGASTWQSERLSSHLAGKGMSTVAFQDRAPDNLDGVLRILSTDLEPRLGAARAAGVATAAARVLRDSGAEEEGFFNEVILFRRSPSPAETHVRRLRQSGAPAAGQNVKGA
jgi:SAM-dependent methyltransferase